MHTLDLERSIHWCKLLEGSYGNIYQGHTHFQFQLQLFILKYSPKCEWFMNNSLYFSNVSNKKNIDRKKLNVNL